MLRTAYRGVNPFALTKQRHQRATVGGCFIGLGLVGFV